MSERPVSITVESLESDVVKAKGLRLVIGAVEVEEEWEPLGPAP